MRVENDAVGNSILNVEFDGVLFINLKLEMQNTVSAWCRRAQPNLRI